MGGIFGRNEGWEARLFNAATSGIPIDLASGQSNREVQASKSKVWAGSRSVPADAIRAALLDPRLAPDPRGLQLRGVRVTGTLNLDYVTLPCRLKITQSGFDNEPSFNHCTLPALNLRGCSMPGLTFRAARIKGDVFLERLQATREVRAVEATIGGQINLTKSKLASHNSKENALTLDGIKIKGDVFLCNLTATGEVRAVDAQIGGQLNLTGATLTNPEPRGDALTLDGINIVSHVVLMREATGVVRAVGARIGGQLILNGGILYGATMFDANNVLSVCALLLDGAHVRDDALVNGITAHGVIRAIGAHFMSTLSLSGEILTSGRPQGDVLKLESITVARLKFDKGLTTNGTVNLAGAKIRHLSVGSSEGKIPSLSSAQGWAVGSIEGYFLTKRHSVVQWLRVNSEHVHASSSRKVFVPQPWREMARVYEQSGHPEEARWIRYKAAQEVTKAARIRSKILRWPYGGVVGYGYRPLFVVPWMVGIFAVSLVLAMVFHGDFTQNPMVVTQSGVPGFNAFLYALDTTIPAATTGQSAMFLIGKSAWLSATFAVLRSIAWILTALLLAGISGILHKD
ncbi:hypothetical protein [Arthrobacter dokdonensis]|uniref:hypothetical protein n=1 Tax=Arthrobacter dokdonellae TaxID=2211210 RepID=UPI001013D2AF|nr:hypothetical protein [Arthrobacter dokdonellae]